MSQERGHTDPDQHDLSVVIWDKLDPLRGRAPLAYLKYRRNDGWGDAPPVRKPGDVHVLAWTSAGVIIGAVMGMTASFFAVVPGIIAGGLAGALLSSLIQSRRRHDSTRHARQANGREDE